ncbi:MAG TPA: hypothetical protein VN154_06275 [Rhizomicrobium sp.]|nr:hypothetical protein [Rhizomicrobium sp.]
MGTRKILRAAWRGAALCLAAAGLSGCFDLSQTIGVGRDGSGRYQVAASASGIIGQGLKNENLVDTADNPVQLTTSDVNGLVTRTATIDFKSLSDVTLGNEQLSLAVTGRDFFGLGPAHVTLRSTLFVDRVRNSQAAANTSAMGEEIARRILGNHAYVLSVTVPGSIDRALPIVIGNQVYQPAVTGDYLHHTVIWRLPLYELVSTHALNFEVDYSAYVFFNSAVTRLGRAG